MLLCTQVPLDESCHFQRQDFQGYVFRGVFHVVLHGLHYDYFTIVGLQPVSQGVGNGIREFRNELRGAGILKLCQW
mgnify:CR=1 FL=1